MKFNFKSALAVEDEPAASAPSPPSASAFSRSGTFASASPRPVVSLDDAGGGSNTGNAEAGWVDACQESQYFVLRGNWLCA